MRLADFATVRSGSVLNRSRAEARFVQAGDIVRGRINMDRLASGALPQRSAGGATLLAGDVVIALRGNINSAAVVAPDEGLNPLFATLDVGIVRANRHLVSPDYLAWYLNLSTTQEALASHRAGSAAPRLSLVSLKDIDLPVPSLDRQERIVAASGMAELESALLARLQSSRRRLMDGLLLCATAADAVSEKTDYPARFTPISM